MARLFIASTLLISTTLGYLTLTSGHDWGDDFAQYLLQAESIAHGRSHEFIEDNRFTIQNSTEPIGSCAYPWGCPLCLVPVYHFFKFDLIALKCVNLLFFEITLCCLYALFAHRLGQRLACLLVAMLAFNPNLLGFLDNILSDTPFLFFCVLSIYLIDKFVIVVKAASFDNDSKWVGQVLLGTAIFAAMITRPNGFFLLPILILCQVIEFRLSPKRKRGKFLACASGSAWKVCFVGMVPYAVCMILKGITDPFLPMDTASQVGYYRFSLVTVAKNAPYYLGLVSNLFGVPHQDKILFGLSLPFLIVGMKARWRQDYHFLLFCALNQLLYTAWPGRGGLRYVLPMLPFYLYFMFQGACVVLNHLTKDCPSPRDVPGLCKVAFSCCLLLTASLLAESAYFAYCNMQNDRAILGPYDADSIEMFAFVRQHTASDARLMFFKPRAMRLLAQRLAFASNRPADLAKADYLVIHKKFEICNQIRFPRSDAVEHVFENSTFVIFRIGAVHNLD